MANEWIKLELEQKNSMHDVKMSLKYGSRLQGILGPRTPIMTMQHQSNNEDKYILNNFKEIINIKVCKNGQEGSLEYNVLFFGEPERKEEIETELKKFLK